jgi:hypothetical protein
MGSFGTEDGTRFARSRKPKTENPNKNMKTSLVNIPL